MFPVFGGISGSIRTILKGALVFMAREVITCPENRKA